ncbi:type I-E CRISPR-associated protein Cas7/Cse4/CasC [Streptomyces sp. NPDC001820]|uniref:type I-E CRISPR-associated protein Cas7/Cse4/CasC n=1 Tax=Streptomyces sp. NPDC001820 TaxID=3364613 RepID=UPI0036827193
MRARYIDLHITQAIPASCLNRGEYDEPKTLQLGNTMRAAISSQCQKRAGRMELEEELDEPAARTRMIPPRVTAALCEAGWPKDLAVFAGVQIARSATAEGLRTDPQAGHRTLAMLYVLADGLVDDLAALCTRHRAALEAGHAQETAPKSDKSGSKKRKAMPAFLPTADVVALLTRRTATINLFGRMLAGLSDADVVGAVQVAWAFTTHTSDPQPDFLTAVEDWPQAGDRGSAHMDTAFLTAGVFYRYATVNLTELIHNLGGDQQQAVELLALFTEVFIMTLPQAKKTSTAPHTVPDLVHYVVRDRRPVSYAAAFDQPIKAAPGGGHLAPTRQTMDTHAATIDRLIGTRHRIAHGYATAHNGPLENLGTRHDSFDELIAAAAHAAAPAAPRVGIA